jgi:hypothetical protein
MSGSTHVLVGIRFCRPVEAEVGEPVFVWQSLYPVLLRLACARLGAEEEVHGTIGVLDDVVPRGAVRITINEKILSRFKIIYLV